MDYERAISAVTRQLYIDLAPMGPVTYLVSRLSHRWHITPVAAAVIWSALYKVDNQTLAEVAYDLADDELHLLLPMLPEHVVELLDEIQL